MRNNQQIGPYELLAVIGEGGTGKVYRAEHKHSGLHVALKTVHIPDARMLTTIRHEIHALSRLEHPGIVKILEHGVHQDQPWYAMELVSGVRLQDFHHLLTSVHPTSDTWEGDSPQDTIKTQGVSLDDDTEPYARRSPSIPRFDDITPTTPANALTQARAEQWLTEVKPPVDRLRSLLTLIRRICEPLAYLHGEGFVHCDLKPDNILIRENGFPVLLDFGLLQRFHTRYGRESIDSTMHHGGTPLYMAPEQIMHVRLDARADMYSLGCILYELLTGEPPYRGKSQEVLAQHLFSKPRLPSHDFPEFGDEVDELIMQLMARVPRERIGYADTLAARLESMGADTTPYPNAPPTQLYLYPPGLVGRQKPLQELQEILKDVLKETETGHCIWLGGPSGIGKTRLAAVFARSAQFQKVRVVSSDCQEQNPQLLSGFRPLLMAIADDVRERGEQEQERIFGHRIPILGLYEPALLTLPHEVDEHPTLLSPQEEALRLNRYVADALSAHTNGQPLLLFLDDLHWADASTLSVLQHILDRGLPAGLIIVGTYRSEEAPAALRGILQHPATEHIELERLNEEDVEAMLSDMLCLETPPSMWSQSICYQSAGNPRFIVEYIQAAVKDGDFSRDATGRWQFHGPQVSMDEPSFQDATRPHFAIPVTLRDLLSRRIQQISSSARLFASCVSVIGQEAPFSLLQAMSEQDEWEMVEMVQELLQSNILIQKEAHVSFVHEQMRHLAYDLLSPAVKMTLHQKAAECLEASPDKYPELLHDIGYHWQQAGEKDKARKGYIEAAQEAVKHMAHDEATRLYLQALYLAPKGHDSEIQLRIVLGESLSHLGRYEEALRYYKEAVGLGKIHHSASLRSQSMYQEAVTLARLGHWEEAQESFMKVLELHRTQGDLKKEGKLLGNIANIIREQGDLQRAEELFQEALAILEANGSSRQVGIVLGNVANVYSSQGKVKKAITYFERALAIHRKENNRYSEALTMANLGVVKGQMKQYDAAQDLLEQSLQICRDIGHRRGEGFALGNLSHILHKQGQSERPLQYLQQAIQMMGETHTVLFEGIFRIYQHKIQRRLGVSPVTLQNHLTLAQECLQTLGKTPYLILLYCEQGHFKLMQQQPANDCLLRALSYARRSQISSNLPNEWSQAITRLQQAILAFQQGKTLWYGEHPSHWPKGLKQPALELC